MEFAEITDDPFTNKTNNYFLVVDVRSEPIPNPSGVGKTVISTGNLLDPSGFQVGQYYQAATQDYEVTGSLSDEAFAHSFTIKRSWMLVPPGFQITDHTAAIGFWLSPKEVEQFILGRLSLKGGD